MNIKDMILWGLIGLIMIGFFAFVAFMLMNMDKLRGI